MLQFGENVLWLLVLIGVMIMIHELGHFWAARFFDVRVEAFSFGFGPRLFGFRRGETDYRFSLILFGGYVKMAGEQVTDENIDDPRAFLAKPRWQRLIIAFAGPFMNILLAIGLVTGLYMYEYQKVADSDMQAVIGHVMPESAAAKAGIQDSDRIVKLNGKENPTWEDVGLAEVTSAYKPMYLTIERDGKRLDTVVTPTMGERSGLGQAGWDERGEIELGSVEPKMPAYKAGLRKGDLLIAVNGLPIHSQIKFQEITKGSGGKPIEIEYERAGQRYKVSVTPEFSKMDGPARWMIGVGPQQKLHIITTQLSFPAALNQSVRHNVKGAMLMVQFLKGMLERRISSKNLSGPIGIGVMAGEAARQGWVTFLTLMSMVSLQLAVFNLLPIPILDGGVILMLLVEMMMQRDLSLRVKEKVFQVGFVCIMVIVAFVIYNDISNLCPRVETSQLFGTPSHLLTDPPMHCQCVRQSELPNTSRLFADVLYHPDRTSAFYDHPLRDLEAYRTAAAQVEMSPERRTLLIDALRIQNGGSAALDKLAQPGTVAVVTGQQVGLFSGPCYTIYKALHAVKLAAWLSENGIPAVPVFWLATEDHDFAEVNHAWVFDSAHLPNRVEMRRAVADQPVGGVTLQNPPLAELRAALAGLPFANEVVAEVEACYVAGNTMGQAFQALLRRLLKSFDILYLDPMLPAFRELAAPALRRAVERAPEISAAVRERNRELLAAGYHAQVHVEETTSFVFLLENGKRLGLRRHGNDYVQNSRRFTGAELADRAASLSPNALLRPVIQDSMVPTVAYIGGPAEVAYLAQSAVIYKAILGRTPLAVPRTGFTILDSRSEKLLDRYGLGLPDFFHGETVLRERIAARLIPPSLNIAAQEAQAAVDAAVARLHAGLKAFDPTLAKALDGSAKKIQYQMEKTARKIGREALRRDQQATADASSLYGLIYPERTLQERLYSILPLLAKHGPELIDTIYGVIELDCPDHRLMTV